MVFNTCAVRENADNRLYGNLGHLLPVKQSRPGMQIAVGGCLAQKDRAGIARAGALGGRGVRHAQHRLAAGAAGTGPGRSEAAQVEIVESLERFPSVLPARRESALLGLGGHLGRLQQHLHLLHRAQPARPGGGPAAGRRAGRDPRRWPADGVVEVTLLGQNVNSYGVGFGDRLAFGKLLRACGGIDGLERVRFTSPHPRDFTDDVIDGHGRDAERHARSCTCRCSPAPTRCCGPCAAPTGAEQVPGHPGPGPGRHARTPPSPPTSSSASPGRPSRISRTPWTWSGGPGSPGAFTFQYSPRPGTPAAGDGRPGARPRWSPSGTSGCRAGRRDLAGRERGVHRPRGRGAGGRGGGPQGRRHAPAVRPGPGQPAGALRARATPRRAPATWSPRW